MEGLSYLLLTKFDLSKTERYWHSTFADFLGNFDYKSRLLKINGN